MIPPLFQCTSLTFLSKKQSIEVIVRAGNLTGPPDIGSDWKVTGEWKVKVGSGVDAER